MQKSQNGFIPREGVLKDLKEFLALHKEQLFIVSAILIVSILSFGRFNTNILISDDWSYFASKYVFGELQPINLNDRRPLILVLYYVLSSLFGLQLKYYYFFNLLLLIFSAVMVYVILKRIYPKHGWLAGFIALVYLIYPVDFTRTWLIMMYIHFCWLASLGTIWMYLEFAKTGKIWMFILAMLGTAIPLGAYEGQFGVLLLASALIAFFLKNVSARRKSAILLGTVGVGMAFLFWRTFIQARLFQINDAYLDSLQFTPAILVERFLHGFYIFFVGWAGPILAQLDQIGFNIFFWLLLYIITGSITLFWASSIVSRNNIKDAHKKRTSLKHLVTLFLIGCAFWVAGYIPVIILYRPALSPISSRVNAFAIPGASMMLVSIVAMLATLFTNSLRLQKTIGMVIILPFVIAGIFTQYQIDQENQLKWEAQKRIWNSVFEVIPNVHDEKSIMLIIPGYQNLRPFESPPFISAWEVEAGAQILYNKPGISAQYYYKDTQPVELFFTSNGFRPIPTESIIPYKKLIFVYYDPKQNSATLVDDLKGTLSLPFEVNHYVPRENIISAEPSTAEFRWLVK